MTLPKLPFSLLLGDDRMPTGCTFDLEDRVLINQRKIEAASPQFFQPKNWGDDITGCNQNVHDDRLFTSREGTHAVLTILKRPSGYIICARMLATEEEAIKHRFSLILNSRDESSTLTFVGKAHSLHRSMHELDDSGEGCFVRSNHMYHKFYWKDVLSDQKIHLRLSWNVTRIVEPPVFVDNTVVL